MEPTATQPETVQDQQAAADAKKRILLVEDDEALAEVYLVRLQSEGFEVKRAANGEEALEIIKSFIPDLMLLDILLPKLSGFEVLASVRANSAMANTKIIVLTALGNSEDRNRALSLGANDYMVKSQFVVADVVERVRQQLGV